MVICSIEVGAEAMVSGRVADSNISVLPDDQNHQASVAPALESAVEYRSSAGAVASEKLPSRRLHFDTMRALMFISVYAGHVTTSHITNYWGSGLVNSASSFGFYAYLVLSGFLITRILVGSDTGKTWSDVREFWLRRTLRIFPIYYLTLAVLLICGWLPEPLPFFTYVSNVYLFLINQMEGPVCHLWSLAVEEQFYLLFPLAFLFTPKKHRLNLVIALLTLSFVVHTACSSSLPGHKWKLLLPSSGQCLLFGAIAGYLDMTLKKKDETRLFLLSLLLNVVLIGAQSFDKTLPHTLIFIDSAALALFFYSLWRTRNEFVCKSLSNKLLVHLGQISYAMYLFHLPILYLLIDFPLPEKIVIGFLSTALLASASWYLFESPINNLRNKLIPSRV